MSNSSTLPNPNVYLNYLSPENAHSWELARNVFLLTLGALIWDILSSIPKDLKLFRRFNAGVIAYGLCRPAALGFVLTSALVKTSPLLNCHAAIIGITCSSILATDTSSFLFLARVQAVYSHSKVVKYAFSVLWLVQVGLSVLIPFSATMRPLYNTGYCINSRARNSLLAAKLMPPLFDTLAFAFISYRLVTKHAYDSDHWRTFLSGKDLPRLSKALLQGGQQYYLLTFGMHVATVTIIGSSSAPRVIVAIPEVAFTSVMACNVQRSLLSEGRDGTEEESGNRESSGLSFTDITSFLTGLYRSEGGTNNTGHVAVQNDIPEVKTMPTADLDTTV